MDKKDVIRHLLDFLEEERRAHPEKDAEIESLATMYRFLPSRAYGAEEPIIPSSLIELRTGAARTFAFLVPRGGGLVTTVEGVPLQVITAQSPLGEALLGKKTGDRVTVEIRGQCREYEIVSSR